ncbi:MAG: DUF4292 domain-containing protein [Bacteroidales bacterium]|nr:DUF4292 domain-containing protein [Bacteroidales bacterium]
MNKRFYIFLIYCLLALTVISGTSCSSKKNLTRTDLREFTASKLIYEVEKNKFDFDNFQAKMNLKIEINDKNFSLKGQIRMKKDSVIWTSLSLPLGLEIARFKMSNDTIYFLNRTEKTYFIEHIQILNDISPMITSFDLIQAVLIGNDINLRESDNYKVEINNNEYNLLITNKLKKSIKHKDDDWKVVMKDICIDPQLYKITKYYIKEYNNSKRKIDLQYSDFEKVNGKYVPTKIMIHIHGDFNLKVNISYSNISVDNNLEYIFNVPKKYDRIHK